jgi:hypothetical protein
LEENFTFGGYETIPDFYPFAEFISPAGKCPRTDDF